MSEERTIIFCERWAKLNDWKTLAEVAPEPWNPELVSSQPAIAIRQHRGTGELRVDIYGCEGGLDVTYTNGGVDDADRSRASWFRDIRTSRTSLRPIRVRFMASGAGDNLRLKS